MTDPGPQVAGVKEGDVLAGKYRVDKVLGVGGMGIVVAAHHVHLDEKVALKFLLPEAMNRPEAVARFLREARTAVRIKSEHVATVKDVGTLDNGSPYMVMEYLDGNDLAAWLRQRGALPIDQAVEFILQACVAVADAHALGIVHRDIKPANLFCVRRSDGQLSIKVLDFGISKVTDVSGTGPGVAITKTQAFMGSPLYMSPEQMQSARKVDARADIWALGVVLFELVAGRTPFISESIMELGMLIATRAPPPLRSFRPDAPAELETVVLKCLEKDPSRRFANVGELSLALLPFAPKRAKGYVERISGIIQADGLSHSALAVPATPVVDATRMSGGTLPPVGRTTLGASRGRSAVLGIALVGALAIGGAATALVVSGKAPARADDPAQAAANAPPAVPATATAATPTTPAMTATGPDPAGAREPLAAKQSPALAPLAATIAPAAPTAAPIATARAPKIAPAAAPVGGAAAPRAPVSPPAPAKSTASAKPAANCTLVKYFDDQGAEHFREDCH
jgi:serine/threonine-protein kinase